MCWKVEILKEPLQILAGIYELSGTISSTGLWAYLCPNQSMQSQGSGPFHEQIIVGEWNKDYFDLTYGTGAMDKLSTEKDPCYILYAIYLCMQE